MASVPRYLIICDDSYFHVTWQCHNRDWLLQWNWAKKLYYDLLLKYKDKYEVEIYAYNFMDNHPHLAGKLKSMQKFSAFFRLINSLFAKAVNKQLKRRGQVVMDRFKSPRIETDEHMLRAMCYIDLNQQRAGKVSGPSDNHWSSYRYYAHGIEDPLITPSPTYKGLGRTTKERQSVYRGMVESLIESDSVNISTVFFIGNPSWVVERYNELREGVKVIQVRRKCSTSPPE